MKRVLFILPYLLIAFAVVIVVLYLNNEAAKLDYPLSEFYGR